LGDYELERDFKIAKSIFLLDFCIFFETTKDTSTEISKNHSLGDKSHLLNMEPKITEERRSEILLKAREFRE